jgi:hypothetical protein
MNANHPPKCLPIIYWLLFFFLFGALVAERSLALNNTGAFPDFPWHGLKLNFAASGNFRFSGHSDYTHYVTSFSPNVINRRDITLCSTGDLTALTLSGQAQINFPGSAEEFESAYFEASIYHYPQGPGSIPEPLQTQSQSFSAYQPGFSVPFNISAALSAGLAAGFSLQLNVCKWQDAGKTDIFCTHLNLNAATIDLFGDAGQCFQLEQTTPADGQKNVDFDQPGISLRFTAPYDPNSFSDDTFYVSYYDQNGYKARANGYIEHNADHTVATFIPFPALMDGVYYVAEVWGQDDAQVLGRTRWIKNAGGLPLKKGKSWAFWTMPNLTDKIDVVPVQVVEQADLISGKPTVVKVFTRWDQRPNVDPRWQVKTLDADIRLSWWENNSGQFDGWQASGQGSYWTPPFGTPLKREYQMVTTPDESYSKNEKLRAQDSVNYYGYKPAQAGAVSFKAEIEPLGQPGSVPRVFTSTEVSRTIRTSPTYRYAFLPIDLGNWAATGRVVGCAAPAPGHSCVDIQGMADQNHNQLRSLFPLAPSRAVRNRGLNSARALIPPNRSQYHPTLATRADWQRLLHWLSRRAETNPTWDAFVGVVPRAWLGAHGVTFPETWFGIDYARHGALLAHDADGFILPHEFGHMLLDWDDADSGLAAGEGFDAGNRRDKRGSVYSLPGLPTMLPLYHLMYRDVALNGNYWINYSQYTQLYNGGLAKTAAGPILGDGEPLLLVSGTVHTGTNVLTREPWYLLESGTWQAGSSGEFTIEFINGAGGLLAGYPLNVSAPEAETIHFLTKVPFPAATAKVRIKRNALILTEVTRSANAPQVTLSAPTTGSVWSGIQNITWSASDGDGNPLFFLIYLSTDGGTTWFPLGMDEMGSSLEIDTREFPNSADCRIKVLASDGVNAFARVSDPFTIRNAPRIISLSPGSGETGVPSRTALRVGFSEPVNPLTLTGVTFFLKDSHNQTVPGRITYAPDEAEVIFHPDRSLDYSNTYTATLTTGIGTPQGIPLESGLSWSFTVEPDIYPPQVEEFYPLSGETRIPVNAALITVRFDEDLDPVTLNTDTFLLKTATGTILDGQISYYPASRTALFRPWQTLEAEKIHTVTLTTGIKDGAGIPLETNLTWSFMTGTENSRWVTLANRFQDFETDLDGDGQWDHLAAAVEVDILFTGTYRLEGRLLDINGALIADADSGNRALPPGHHTIRLYFPKQAIISHGVSGPYYLADLILRDLEYPASLDLMVAPYVTRVDNLQQDLTLAAATQPDPAHVGVPLALTIFVKNQDLGTAAGVTIAQALPPEVQFLGATSEQGTCTCRGDGSLHCLVGDLAGLTGAKITVTVLPLQVGTFTSSVSVTSLMEARLANNHFQISVPVLGSDWRIFFPLILRSAGG